MQREGSSRGIEIVTAIMLGLASVVTALGAWQAAQWTRVADEFAGDASDARDVSVSQAVAANNSLRIDQEASAQALAYFQLEQSASAFEDVLFYQFSRTSALARTTSGFADAWEAWAAGGFDPAANPLEDADYLVQRDGLGASYAQAAVVMNEASKTMKAKAGVLAQAALIYSLSLFLLGISSLNRLRAVRGGIVALGIAVFIGGLVISSMAL
jgi:hypothetical protein